MSSNANLMLSSAPTYNSWMVPLHLQHNNQSLGHLVPTHPSTSFPIISRTDMEFGLKLQWLWPWVCSTDCRYICFSHKLVPELGIPHSSYRLGRILLQNEAQERFSSLQSFSWTNQAVLAISFFCASPVPSSTLAVTLSMVCKAVCFHIFFP